MISPVPGWTTEMLKRLVMPDTTIARSAMMPNSDAGCGRAFPPFSIIARKRAMSFFDPSLSLSLENFAMCTSFMRTICLGY